MTPALEKAERAFEELRCAWRFRWVALGVSAALAVIGWLVVFALPDRYAADARVFVDTSSSLKPVLKALAMEQDVQGQVNYVRQSLLEGPRLEKIAVDTGVLTPKVTDLRERARVLEALSQRITFTVTGAGTPGEDRSVAGTIYGIHYTDSDRDRSLGVVQHVLDSFIQETAGEEREGSHGAQQFLEAQIKDYEQRLSAAEDKLATFKKTNDGLMPNEQGGYFTHLQNELDETKKTETDLAVATSRREELIKQLQNTSATGGSLGGAGGGDTLSQIQEMQARLDGLRLQFTDQHPDVIAARATLEELKARRAAEVAALRRGDASDVSDPGGTNDSAANIAASNPIYQSIQLELNKANVEMAALRRELVQHQGAVAELRRHLDSAPRVEAEFQQLTRDYDVNKAQYTVLLENYQKARLGEQADQAGSVRFAVVLPPTSPPVPVWPRRVALLGGIWIASLVLGAAVAFGMQRLYPVVTTVGSLNQITRFPVLGTVGIAFPSLQAATFRRHLLTFSVASVVLVVALIVALGLNRSGMRLDLQHLALVKT